MRSFKINIFSNLLKKMHIHKWVKKSKYYDCSAICMWSSGIEYYKYCYNCGTLKGKNSYEKIYKTVEKNSPEYKSVLEEVYKKKD